MKKIGYLYITILLLILTLIGCAEKPAPELEGKWDLEMFSLKNGEFTIGQAYNNYTDYNGEKSDLVCNFKDDGTFILKSSEESLQGEYKTNKISTDTIRITMNFNDGEEIIGTYGKRRYMDDKEVESLTFTYKECIYSFLR